jgi:hypothetical protein
MIVVLYKKKEEYWNTPFLSVEPDEYKSSFPSSSSSQQKGEQKKKEKKTATTTKTTSVVVEDEDDMKLEASLRSIEKAAASKSLEAKAQIPRVTLPQQSSKVIQSSSKGTNDVVAPTTFQNTIMFELD